mgnify:CR=1 FL=1
MGMFGGKEYSKEAYKNAEDEAKAAENIYRYRGTVQEVNSPHNAKAAQNIYNELSKKAADARQRVEKLYGKGQAEANALYEEHNRLVVKAQEAIKAVEDFEKDKLGMSLTEE